MYSARLGWLGLAMFFHALAPASAAETEYPPGPLSRAHAQLEGLASCTACHAVGHRASPRECLACHPEIAARIARRTGPHGREPLGDRGCGSCHPEHRGRDVPIVDWGPNGRDRYDHARTGWPLSGAHARTSCARCHRPDRIEDDVVRKLLAVRPQRQTYLGAPVTCVACHPDTHGGQLSRACETCHSERAWRPADRFAHAKTKFPLVGRHEHVACKRCHPFEPPVVYSCLPPYECAPPAELWVPDYGRWVRYRPVPHDACERCHANAHAVQFDSPCSACHVPGSWLKVQEDRFVPRHAETRYPLVGAHVKAPCRSCHGPSRGEKPRFVGLSYRACSDCHADAHVGQLGTPPRRDCGACHLLSAFKPVVFSADHHAKSAYPLVGSHRAVACKRCHPDLQEIPSRFPTKERAVLARQGRPVKLSAAQLAVPRKPFERCDGCHRNPHGERNMSERVAREGCGGCHEPTTFRLTRFDHAKTSFPLAGKHAQTSCSACHPKERVGVREIVRYTGVSKACGTCHDDVHVGQLDIDAPERKACDRCHDTAAGWKKTRFVHAPPFTEYRLEGRHAPVKCGRCHFAVSAAGHEVVRYRPLPAECERCHADEHRGTFNAYEPSDTNRTPAGGIGTSAPGPRGIVSPPRCGPCHDVNGWSSRRFAHERTGFALLGRHGEVACGACHRTGYTDRLSASCASCHPDVHVGQLGERCETCHDARDWAPRDPQLAHRRTNFPLIGRHANIPCQECHADRRDRGYARTTAACVACHDRDYAAARLRSLDHQASGLSSDCRPCHSPAAFTPAVFPAHETCFQLQARPHAGIRCGGCHTRVAGLVATGACFTGNAACTRCHSCAAVAARHTRVAGYQCTDRKCYECHSFVR